MRAHNLITLAMLLGACRDRIPVDPVDTTPQETDLVDTDRPGPIDTDIGGDDTDIGGDDTDIGGDDTDDSDIGGDDTDIGGDDTDDTDIGGDDTDDTDIGGDDTDIGGDDTDDTDIGGDDTDIGGDDTDIGGDDTVDTSETGDTVDTDTTPVDDTDTPPVDDTDTTPVDDTDTPPVDDTDTTPVDDTDTTPVDDTDTPPVDDTDTTPVDDTDTPPVDDTDTTPVDDTDTPPVDDTDTPPVDDTDTPPVDDTDTPPVDDTDTPPVDDTDTPPVDDTDTPPVDDTDTPPVDDTDTPPVDDTVDTAVEPIDTAPCGFDDPPASWEVPGTRYQGTATFDELASALDCPGQDEVPAYGLLDIDGDGLDDLVITDRCTQGGIGQVGEQFWQVHFNEGDGFNPVAVDWDVPGNRYAGNETFDVFANGQDCQGGAGRPEFGLRDLDGDARPDLVVTDPCFEPAVGEDHWRVYLNNGAGFDDTFVEWDLPGAQYGGDETFDSLAEGQQCQQGSSKPAYELHDLDGDGLLDLVVTDTCGYNSVGESEWLIYFNDGGGFAGAATSWSAPGAIYDGLESFDNTTAPLECNGDETEPAYGIVDMDGDGLLDLVVTDLCELGGGGIVSEEQWNVHLNNGVGFDTPVSVWPVPGAEYLGDESFDVFEEGFDCNPGYETPSYGLRDLDADGRPDLVIVDTCDFPGDIGESWWRWYPNEGDGFGPRRRYSLPGALFAGAESFDGFSVELSCTNEDKPRARLLDLDGDGWLDLVGVDRCNEILTGERFWSFATSTCKP